MMIKEDGEEPSCHNCKFSYENHFYEEGMDTEPRLYCHRYPPSLLSPHTYTNTVPTYRHPTVDAANWCGEYRPDHE